MPEGHHHHHQLNEEQQRQRQHQPASSLLNACSAHCLAGVPLCPHPSTKSMKWLLFVCLTLTGSNACQDHCRSRVPLSISLSLTLSLFSFLPPCIFVAFNFSLIVKIFILICAFCTFCSPCLALANPCARLPTG